MCVPRPMAADASRCTTVWPRSGSTRPARCANRQRPRSTARCVPTSPTSSTPPIRSRSSSRGISWCSGPAPTRWRLGFELEDHFGRLAVGRLDDLLEVEVDQRVVGRFAAQRTQHGVGARSLAVADVLKCAVETLIESGVDSVAGAPGDIDDRHQLLLALDLDQSDLARTVIAGRFDQGLAVNQQMDVEMAGQTLQT